MSDLQADVAEFFRVALREAAPATARQRRWAIGNFVTFARARNLHRTLDALRPEVLDEWQALLEKEGTLSLPSLRAHMSALRSLDSYLVEAGKKPELLPGGLNKLPTPRKQSQNRETAHRLMRALQGPKPASVHPDAWIRFAALTNVLAACTHPEGVISTLPLTASAKYGRIKYGPGPGTALSREATTAVERWLMARRRIVGNLEGSDPGMLWVRVAPSRAPVTNTFQPAGLPITTRGLRLSFATICQALTSPGQGPDFSTLDFKDLRALYHQ